MILELDENISSKIGIAELHKLIYGISWLNCGAQ